jgi:hypothetical protein
MTEKLAAKLKKSSGSVNAKKFRFHFDQFKNRKFYIVSTLGYLSGGLFHAVKVSKMW